MTPKEVLALCREKDVKAVDLRFMDFPGLWQHFTIPVEQAGRGRLRGRPGLRRLQHPRLAGDQRERHARGARSPRRPSLDPFTELPTLSMICNIQDPITREDYTPRPAQRRPQGGQLPEEHRHRRHLLHRPGGRVLHLRRRPLRSAARTQATTTSTASRASGTAAATRSPNLGYKLRYKEGYFPVPPADQMMDIRNEMMQTMIDCGLDVEAQHHEVATGGQAEIDLRFDELVTMADKMMMYKYIIKNVATKHGKTVTFMPKPLFSDNGSGMHTHISLWKGGEPLFAGSGYAGLSEMALYAIGGILKHAPAILRLHQPHDQQLQAAGARASRRRSTWPTRSGTARPRCRIPMYSPSPKAKRVEFRCPDPSCNPYLAFSAHADGGDRRDPEQDRSGRAAGQGHLRPAAGRAGRSAQDARLAGRGARRAASRTTSSCSAATSSPRT